MWIGLKPPREGCRDQTEGISCTVAASLHPHAHPARSHARTPVISAGGRACAKVNDQRVTVCVSHSSSPSFIPGPVILLPPSFVHSPNPSHPILISVFFSLPLAFSHKNTHMYPSIHPHAQLARPSPWQAAQFDVGLCKEILISVRYHCLMVSPWQLREQGPAMQAHRILNLSKEISFVCWWWDVVN